MLSVAASIRAGDNKLAQVADSGRQEARLLLAKALSKRKEWTYSHPEAAVPGAISTEYARLIEQRARGYPLPYLLGEWSFYGRDYFVREGVLIPRPETEKLVELAIDWARSQAGRTRLRILDVGTGSGCIAITLAAEIPNADVLGVDLSPAALQVAGANAARHCRDNIRFQISDLLGSVRRPDAGFDLICANLPYIPREKVQQMPVSTYEPTLALDGGTDGLTLVRRLLNALPEFAGPQSLALLEIDEDQGSDVLQAAALSAPEAELKIFHDFAGKDRIAAVRF